MENIFKITIIIHVIAGIGALIFGAVAIMLKRNTPKHKPVGRIYFWCMTIIFVTGLFLSVAKGFMFLFLIGIFTYYSTLVAYRSLRLKKLHEGQKPLWIDWLVEGIAAISFLGMIAFGVIAYYQTSNTEAIVPLVFGVLGLMGVYKNLMRFIKGPTESMYWLKLHIGNMLGSYIGAITAFVVNQSSHIPLNPIFLWLGPTVIIVPIIIAELKKVKSEPFKATTSTT